MKTIEEQNFSSEALYTVLSGVSQQMVDSEQVDEIMSRVAQTTMQAAQGGTFYDPNMSSAQWANQTINEELRTAYPQLFGV